jgi:hypothetical protein
MASLTLASSFASSVISASGDISMCSEVQNITVICILV